MRHGQLDARRMQLSRDVLQIDFHDFIRRASGLTDAELAAEFHLDVKDILALKSKLHRN